MIKLIVNPGQELAIPHVVEHAGQVAVDAYVLAKTGVDLAQRRAAAEAKRQAAEKAARVEAEKPKAPDAETVAEQRAIERALAAAAIPVNPAPVAPAPAAPNASAKASAKASTKETD
jgi:hypothetical protein